MLSDEERAQSLLGVGDGDNQVGQAIVTGMGLLGGSAACSLVGAMVGFVAGPVGSLAMAVPGAIFGGIVGGAVGNKVGREVDKLRLKENKLRNAMSEIEKEAQKIHEEAIAEKAKPEEIKKDEDELENAEFIAHMQQGIIQDYEDDFVPEEDEVEEKEDPTVIKRVVVKVQQR
ncbi:MAG: hypothetical protein HGB11_03540 [Chlorobiales bacterium]|nr:hypothetical protein [Chlorobiales bacterium]